MLVRPAAGEPLDVGIRHAADDGDALATIFAMGIPADIAEVWIDGHLTKN